MTTWEAYLEEAGRDVRAYDAEVAQDIGIPYPEALRKWDTRPWELAMTRQQLDACHASTSHAANVAYNADRHPAFYRQETK